MSVLFADSAIDSDIPVRQAMIMMIRPSASMSSTKVRYLQVSTFDDPHGVIHTYMHTGKTEVYEA
jgi:hypothetical protein